MISIVITSFKEPQLIGRAIQAVLDNNLKEKYELIVAAPDKETADVVETFSKKDKRIKYFKDPGKGKSYALNMIFKILKGKIWIFTDGDVYLDKHALPELLKIFEDPHVGAATGRPVSTNSRKTMFGFWSHLLYDAGAHRIRNELDKKGKFIECSGYLFAFRNNITKNIPLNVAEDSIIPYLATKKGYRVRYAAGSRVYVGNPSNLSDFVKQRVRTAKAHETLTDYAPFFPKVKSFKNEVRKGTLWALSYPKNLQEFWWTILLFFTRLYIWIRVKWEDKILKKRYGDNWERVDTTKH